MTDRIRSNPYLGQLYSGDERYRTMPIKGTPYLVFYAIDEDAQTIDIDAVWSTQRGKGPELG